ncbi:HIT domain-containing protein, partial [Aspergillus sp. HF37]
MAPSPPSSSCPFCRIASTYPPRSPSSKEEQGHSSVPGHHDQKSPNSTVPNILDAGDSTPAHLILSTDSVLAFLDIMPLTRGHVLLVTREHYDKLNDVDVGVARELGQWLPVLSRAVSKTVFGEDGDAHWNVVQNNGIRAAQQVPHLHFHIVPRPSVPTTGRWAAAQASYAMFGRGQRDDLDEAEGEELAGVLREALAREVRR